MYSIEDLGTIEGYTSGAEAINDAGTVTGILTYQIPNSLPTLAFVWSSLTGMQILQSPAGPTEGRSINNQGQIAGVIGPVKAARWDQQGQLVVLDNADFGSSAHAINEDGSAVGQRFVPKERYAAVIWGPKGTPTDLVPNLGGLGPGIDDEAHGINKYAWVVGQAGLQGGDSHAFLWSAKDGMQDLTPNATGLNDAVAITDSGRIIGTLNDRAAAWSGGVWHKLQTPDGMTSSALALSDAGSIVGFTKDQGGVKRAALWDWVGNLTDLTGLVPLVPYPRPVPKGFAPEFDWVQEWVLLSATGINTKGQIVGYGEHRGESRAYRLSPVVPHYSQSVAALVMQILFGVRLGEGGVVLGPQGPEPQPPVGPAVQMSPRTQDALLGLALYEAAGLLENAGARTQVQQAALAAVAQVIALQIGSLDRN
jgi:uncharacterized membrane protein